MTPRIPGKKNKKAVVYVRVSTEEQTVENQLPELERIAEARGFKDIEVIEEVMSAAKHRPGFDRVMAMAHKGQCQAVIIWALDRLGRSMTGNLQTVLALDEMGVEVISVQESWLQMRGPVRSLLVAVFGWVSEQERLRIKARTVIGMKRAKLAGRKLGRPRVEIDADEAMRLKRKGYSLRKAAKKLGVGHSTLQRFYRSQSCTKK